MLYVNTETGFKFDVRKGTVMHDRVIAEPEKYEKAKAKPGRKPAEV